QSIHDIPSLTGNMPEQERFLQPLFPVAPRHVHLAAGKRVNPRVIHACGKGTGSGGKILYLLRLKLVPFEKESQFDHVGKGAPRMSGHEIRHDELFFTEASALGCEAGEE